jgi:anti-sigma B factor antagonist
VNAVIEPGDEQGVAVLRLSGEITSANAAEIGVSALAGLDGAGSLRVDMSEVTYLSSAGLRVLVLLHRDAESTGTKVTLYGLSARLRFIMRAAGFLELFSEAEEAA